MSRHTFVIQVYSDGPATLENLTTQERVPVTDLAAIGAQIELWLAASREEAPASRPGCDPRSTV